VPLPISTPINRLLMILIHLEKKQFVAFFINLRHQSTAAVVDLGGCFNPISLASRPQLLLVGKSL